MSAERGFGKKLRHGLALGAVFAGLESDVAQPNKADAMADSTVEPAVAAQEIDAPTPAALAETAATDYMLRKLPTEKMSQGTMSLRTEVHTSGDRRDLVFFNMAMTFFREHPADFSGNATLNSETVSYIVRVHMSVTDPNDETKMKEGMALVAINDKNEVIAFAD